MKKEFYSKHLTKYMGDTIPISHETVKSLNIDNKDSIFSPRLINNTNNLPNN
jgi:hypothetical protein